MRYLLASLRFLFFAIMLILVLILLYFSYYLLSIFGRKFSVRINYKMTMFIGCLLRFLFGIKVKVYGKEKIPKKAGFLMPSNHLGYIELAALLKVSPLAFVGKEEIGTWPFIGAIAKACGTVFVNRERGGMSETYIKETEEVLKNHINIWFSPEKTTTDGTWLRPFSSALFVAANRTKHPVVPAVFIIKKLNGKAINSSSRREAAWATSTDGQETPFFTHFTHLMTYRRLDMEMHILDPIIPDYDDSDIEERRKFSDHVHELMADELEKYEPEFDRERKYLNKEEENNR